MKKLSVIHLGVGNVGNEVVQQIKQQKKYIEKKFGVSLIYKEKFTSKNSKNEILKAIKNIDLPFVLIDTTASDQTVMYIEEALKCDGFAALANKKPLSGKQEDFELLQKLGEKRLFHECVVGAGLLVIQTLQNLIDTGDEIIEIQGCFSGTLGFLFSEMDKNKSFSQAVLEAKQKGFTEPDPRDDLSGLDVARKALILSRLLGNKLELSDIRLKGLYPKEMQHLTVEEFLKQVNTLDNMYKQKQESAKRQNKVLRFVATVKQHACTVGLEEIDRSSDIGNLQGPDNLIVFKTKRYSQNPLVIKGPGAGVAVTAAGVFADILSVVKMI